MFIQNYGSPSRFIRWSMYCLLLFFDIMKLGHVHAGTVPVIRSFTTDLDSLTAKQNPAATHKFKQSTILGTSNLTNLTSKSQSHGPNKALGTCTLTSLDLKSLKYIFRIHPSPQSLTAHPCKNDGWKTILTLLLGFGKCSPAILNFL